MKKALITGATGQDGAYLTELLLSKEYQVFGGCRKLTSENSWRLKELGLLENKNFSIVECDITNQKSIQSVIRNVAPHEVYNLAAQSFVGVSFKQPSTTGLITGIGAVNVMEAIRVIDLDIRFFQASSSEMFGEAQSDSQTEETPFHPKNPYGVAKLYAHWMTINYRQSYEMFASTGILFNHESPLRGAEFVTRKITNSVALITLGKLDCLYIGNLDARRDWGYAKDYVKGIYQIMQLPHADDYILATHKVVSVRDFIVMAFKSVDIDLVFHGQGVNEIGIAVTTGKVVVRVDPSFYRPIEVAVLKGDATKALDAFGWHAETSLAQLCSIMVSADLARASR